MRRCFRGRGIVRDGKYIESIWRLTPQRFTRTCALVSFRDGDISVIRTSYTSFSVGGHDMSQLHYNYYCSCKKTTITFSCALFCFLNRTGHLIVWWWSVYVCRPVRGHAHCRHVYKKKKTRRTNVYMLTSRILVSCRFAMRKSSFGRHCFLSPLNVADRPMRTPRIAFTPFRVMLVQLSAAVVRARICLPHLWSQWIP